MVLSNNQILLTVKLERALNWTMDTLSNKKEEEKKRRQLRNQRQAGEESRNAVKRSAENDIYADMVAKLLVYLLMARASEQAMQQAL